MTTVDQSAELDEGGGDVETLVDPSLSGEETVQAEQTPPEVEPVAVSAVPVAVSAVPFEPPEPESPAPLTQTMSMTQMYDTWVELADTIETAQSELQSLLSNRKNAEALRQQAQGVLEQAEAAWEEAGRLGEASWRAFGRGFTASLPGFTRRLRMIKEVDEARKSQAQLRREGNIEAWEEADRARQKATAELLKALTSVAAAAAHIKRELRETDNLPVVADSLRKSALEDLRCAQAIGDELALLGQEALGQLGATQVAGQSSIVDEPIAGQLETQHVAPAPAAPAPEVGNPKQGISRAAQGGNPGNASPQGGATAVAPEPAGPSTTSAAEQLRKEFEAAAGTEKPGPSPKTASAVKTTAADDLQKELEALRPNVANSAQAEALQMPSSKTEPDTAAAPQADGPAPESDPQPPIDLPEKYSGRVYLMFPSSLGQDDLGSVWEILEEVSGSGTIVDNRLVSGEAGVQFTLELGKKALSVKDLLKRMPGAGLTALEDDRLRVDWPR